jgi:protein gp37
MAFNSKIEWTTATWNPVTGCTKISAGCQNCYAERLALRLKAMGVAHYQNGFTTTIHEQSLPLPLKWKAPRTIFVNSMSDLFHSGVPIAFIEQVFQVMKQAEQHTFQVLTKRPNRALELFDRLPWASNVWMGVTVESEAYLERIDQLRRIPSAIRFISLEPLLSSLPELNLQGIHWVIVGGESGQGARPMKKEWVLNIQEQCRTADVPFFFKQWGGIRKTATGSLLNGRFWKELPRARFAVQ